MVAGDHTVPARLRAPGAGPYFIAAQTARRRAKVGIRRKPERCAEQYFIFDAINAKIGEVPERLGDANWLGGQINTSGKTRLFSHLFGYAPTRFSRRKMDIS